MLEFFLLIALGIVLPFALTRIEMINGSFVDPYLREIFTGIFVVVLLYFLNISSIKTFAAKLRRRETLRRHPMIGYLACFLIGGSILCGYWWFTGKIVKPASHQQEVKKFESLNIGASLVIDAVGEKFIDYHIHINNAVSSIEVNNLRYNIQTPYSLDSEFIPLMPRTLQPGRDLDISPQPCLVCPREYNSLLLTLLYSVEIEGVQHDFISTYRFHFSLIQAKKGGIINPEATEPPKRSTPQDINAGAQIMEYRKQLFYPFIDPKVGSIDFGTGAEWLEKNNAFIEFIPLIQRDDFSIHIYRDRDNIFKVQIGNAFSKDVILQYEDLDKLKQNPTPPGHLIIVTWEKGEFKLYIDGILVDEYPKK
jgi:hypothetical protein